VFFVAMVHNMARRTGIEGATPMNFGATLLFVCSTNIQEFRGKTGIKRRDQA